MLIDCNNRPTGQICRCSISAYEDSEEYEEWLSFLENGGTTEEFYKNKNASRNRAKKVKK